MFTKITKSLVIAMFFAVTAMTITSTVRAEDVVDETPVVEAAVVIETPIVIENTYELCTDFEDNDFNGSSDEADENCEGYLTQDSEVSIVIENTYELCTDFEDNDFNGSSDEADENCVEVLSENEVETPIVIENTYELCTDGIDNDFNGSWDEADENCVGHLVKPEVEEPTKRSSRGGQKKSSGASTSGEVLGASTDGSCKVLTTYIKIGQDNNVEDVKTLQAFLNTNLGINLPVTGFYGELTEKAVKDFQLKYSEEVLKPWVDLGLHSSEEIPTGYVYKTTQFTINTMLCPELEIPAPTLN